MTTRDDDNRVTMGERYGSATESSNLRIKETTGDADVLIAAGWLADTLGSMLFRLAREYDGAKAEHGIAEAEFERLERAAAMLEKQALAEPDPIDRATDLEVAEQMRETTRTQAISARLFILMNLKSLGPAKQALFTLAWSKAQRAQLEIEPNAVASIISQALDIHLDPTCHHCQGRGYNGGYGAPRVMCRRCSATGRRSARDIGKDEGQREFGAMLLREINRLLGRAAKGMIQSLHGSSIVGGEERTAAEQRLAVTLAALRTPEAQAD